ncbi:MAG: phosphopentomutase, partial [Romboutsia sp.]|nr:phosphopentomutase [Romboutsia sp.]
MKFKRIFLMVLDGLGVGETNDASNFGDVGANTLGHIKEKYDLFVPNLKKIGFLDTLNMNEDKDVEAYYSIAKPNNAGKDSLNGHYEMMGIKNNIPFRTFN